MDIKIHSVHFDADQRLLDFVRVKVSKLSQFYDHMLGAEVYLRLDNSETAENKVVEVKIDVPTLKDLFAKRQSKSFEESTDLAVEAIRAQLLKHKQKQRGL